MPTTRSDFEKLVELRLQEAQLLLDHQQWDGAYYLAGYAVEYALKVKIIGIVMQSDAFPERRSENRYYQHDLEALRHLAGLEAEMEADLPAKFAWTLVRDWNEQSRYALGRSEQAARDFLDAIKLRILPWIKARC